MRPAASSAIFAAFSASVAAFPASSAASLACVEAPLTSARALSAAAFPAAFSALLLCCWSCRTVMTMIATRNTTTPIPISHGVRLPPPKSNIGILPFRQRFVRAPHTSALPADNVDDVRNAALILQWGRFTMLVTQRGARACCLRTHTHAYAALLQQEDSRYGD